MTDKLEKLTIDYIAATDDLIASRRFGEGLFGMHDSARSSPVHMEYYNAMESAVKELAGDSPDAETADAIVTFLLHADRDHPCSTLAEWMLIAIQNHALPLIPYMSDSGRAEQYKWFNAEVPRLQRLPIQKQIAKELKK